MGLQAIVFVSFAHYIKICNKIEQTDTRYPAFCLSNCTKLLQFNRNKATSNFITRSELMRLEHLHIIER